MYLRKKLFVLSASAMAFAGLAAAQSPCGGAGTANNTTLPNLLRVEATNDQVTNLNISCPNTGNLAQGQVVLQLSAPVTSTQVAVGTNEATLIVNGTAYQGTVSGNTVVFNSVTFPVGAAFTMSTANIRVNSNTVPVNTYVTETLNVYNQGVVAFSTAGLGTATYQTLGQVGLVQQGFATPKGSGVQNYVICQSSGAQTLPSFTVTIAEQFGGAFKTQIPGTTTANGGNAAVAITCGAGPGCTSTNGEQGTYPASPGAAPSIGAANSGTRFLLTFAGIPSGVTLWMPSQVTGTGQLKLALTSSATGAFSYVAPTGTGANVGFASIAAANGAATAVYEVVSTDNTVLNESVAISGQFGFAANFATTAQPAVTVTVTPAPTGSTNVPNFATSGNTALTLSAWTTCQTSLLFPFVTNQLGFDTGLVLVNASTDNLGAAGKSIATAQSGTCALNFYGSGAPSTQPVAAPGGTQASGTTNAFLLSAVAPGFQGYMIATCTYLYGHGYGFLAFDLTKSDGVVEGYIAEVLGAVTGTRTVSTGIPEAVTF